MAVFNNIIAGASGAAGAAGFQIDRSLRFNSADSAYLSRDFSAGNRKTWTWSGWVKRSTLGFKVLFGHYNTSSSPFGAYIGFLTDQIKIVSNGIFDLGTTAQFRDASAWYHIVVAADTTLATQTDRIKLYVNGERITDFSTATWPSQNADTQINQNTEHDIGKMTNSGLHFDGYMAEIHFVDGQALAASDFGEYDDNNVWQPKDPTFTSPNNGTTWSNGLTGSALSGYPATNGFDGSTSTWFYAGASQTTTFTFSPAITGTKFEIYALSGGAWPEISVNGTGIGTHNSVWVDVSSQAGGSLSTIACPGASGSQSGFAAVRVDGVILVDGANEYGTNGFHLDFSDIMIGRLIT
jgi:hypothetical protein